MSNVNPYASPQTDFESPPPIRPSSPTKPQGMWSKGKVLVMHKDAPFPNYCVKSGVPATERLTRKLSWHHPAIALSIFLGLLVYVILALVLTKRATIFVPLSPEWFARRRNAILTGWLIAFAGLALFIGGFFLPEGVREAAIGWCILGGIVLMIVGWAYGGIRSRVVWPAKIDDQYVYLKGVNPSLLAELPPWPGP